MSNITARLYFRRNPNSFLLPLGVLLCLVVIFSSNAAVAFAQALPARLNASLHFSTQTRLGFHSGDDWEPAITSDRFGHLYAMYKHYDVTGGQTCPGCGLHMVFQRSDDGGQTWSHPRAIAPGPFK